MLQAKKVKFISLFVFLALFPLALPAQADPLQNPDFAVRITWPSPGIGYIVRDGTPPITSQFFPVYQIGGFGCDYGDNVIELVSHFGFTGDITLELLNLPAGVTSQTGTSVSITGPTPSAGQSPDVDLDLTASSTATLGDATITLRATSGSTVHTVDLPIRVVDTLPTCIGDTFGGNPPRPDRVTIEEVEYDAGKGELQIEATECCDGSSAMLWVTVASTGEVIGAMDLKGTRGFSAEFEGELSWPVNPGQIKVISSPSGGWNISNVQLK